MSHPKVSFIFIHGFCFGPSLWVGLLPYFREFSHQLVNYSLYKNTVDKGFNVDLTMEDLRKIVQTHPNDYWVLVGHSLGGYLSLEMIHQSGEMIDACILVNSHLHNDTNQKKQIRDKQIKLIERRGLDAYLRVFYHNIDSTHAEKWQNQFHPCLDKKSILDQLAYMRDREVHFTSVQDFTRNKFLGFIHARHDNLVPTTDLYSKFSLLNAGQIEVVSGGHLSPLNQRDACIAALNKMWPHLSFSLR